MNSADVSRVLDEAFGAAGHVLSDEDREIWKRNAQAAAEQVQSHPDVPRLVEPPAFVVEVSTEGWSVSPLSGGWSPTHVVEPGTLGTHPLLDEVED